MDIAKFNTSGSLILAGIASLFFTFAAPLQAQTLDLSARTANDLKRDITSKPAEIIEFAGVKKGSKVLDLLGGAGYYSQILKRAVGPKGSVVLQNNQAYIKYLGKYLNEKKAKGHLDGITELVSEVDDLKLGTGQFDTAFLVLGYHDFFYQEPGWAFDVETAMPQLYKSLKPGGKLLIIDHNAAKGRGIKDAEKLHRIEDVFVRADLEKRGFKFIKALDILKNDSDDHTINVFKPEIRRKTDRFVMLFEKV